MKRPVSILCISDLHYEEGDMRAIDNLCKDYEEFVNDQENAQNKRWHPDYIVVAGDVVNYNHLDYSQPQKNIKKLMRAFGVDKRHIIVVPGNHDKSLPKRVKISGLKNDKNIFEKFCRDEKGDCVKGFGKTFYRRFKKYIGFCRLYHKAAEDEDYAYYAPEILDSRIKCLSGVKVFKDDNLCFLVVNTEWLYVSKDQVDMLYNEKLTEHQTVYEKCQLCSPIVKDTCKKIIASYPHYTVVTVMHRGFEDLTWGEKNVTNKLNIDAIRYIEDVSDIVLTGHDHNIHTDPPTLIKNRIQHFKLGSVGRKEPATGEHIRTGSIIRFMPTENKIELLHLVYDQEGDQRKWHFNAVPALYPLYSKFDRNDPLPLQASCTTLIKAQSKRKKDIENAIKSYFEIGKGISLHIVEAKDETIEQQLEAVSLENNKCNYIVVYFLHDVYYSKATEKLSKRASIEEKIENFEKKHLEAVLLNRLVINKIVIQVPLFDYGDEKNTCGE